MTALPQKVAVIGGGDIGCGWAALCASAGWPVTVFDSNASGLERAATDVPRRTRALVALERATSGIVERGLKEFTQARSLFTEEFRFLAPVRRIQRQQCFSALIERFGLGPFLMRQVVAIAEGDQVFESHWLTDCFEIWQPFAHRRQPGFA